MLSLTKCKKKLNKNGTYYTDEEVLIIRNFLYKLAEVYHNHTQKNTSSNDSTSINQ